MCVCNFVLNFEEEAQLEILVILALRTIPELYFQA